MARALAKEDGTRGGGKGRGGDGRIDWIISKRAWMLFKNPCSFYFAR
jgi:hypothetical protein